MTLHQWFIKNTKTPLGVLGAFVTLIYFFFAYYAVRTNQEHQYNNFRDLIVTSVNIGVQQSNRELIESAFSRSVDNLGARAAYLCKNGDALMTTALDVTKCKDIPVPNFFNRLLKFNLSGFSEYEIYFLTPKYNIQGAYFWVLIATFLVLLASAWIILRIRKKFIQDILIPLESNLLTEGDVGIYEFQRIREKIKEVSAIKEKEVFEDAILESKKAFSHNVKSPLRNLRLIREKFKNLFDEDDTDLFDSAVSQISSMADKLKVRTARTSRSSLETNKLALIEIEELVQHCIKKKLHEWTDIGTKVVLNVTSKIKGHSIVAVESSEMNSLLSNLLNNSLEAGSTQIDLLVSTSDNHLQLDIVDNGRGVPHLIRDSLFNEGITSGKDSGTGYGLYHARKHLKKWHGNIELIETSSTLTKFRLSVPLWVTPKIRLGDKDTIVIVDDKPIEIARIKKSIELSKVKNKILSFTNQIDFLKWYRSSRNPVDHIALLADFDLGENSVTGIELIQSLGLTQRSVLITDNYEDDRLYSHCRSLGISIAPKSNVEKLSFLVH